MKHEGDGEGEGDGDGDDEKSGAIFYFTSVCTKSINFLGNFHLLISSLKHD